MGTTFAVAAAAVGAGGAANAARLASGLGERSARVTQLDGAQQLGVESVASSSVAQQ